MKQAVTKLIARHTEMFNQLSLSKDTGYLGVRIIIIDTIMIFHTEGVISDMEYMEAMVEINTQLPE